MSAHDYHDRLPGYDPAQILHDGCRECEDRAALDDYGISTLDRGNFARAWQRAVTWQRTGLPDGSHAEMPLLHALWAVQVQLEHYGLPIGTLPNDGLMRTRGAE